VASTPTDRRIHLVLDFDGTITLRDTGDELFRTFGQFEPIHTELLDGQMTVAEYYRRSVAMLPAELTPEQVHAWALTMDVDPGMEALVALCRRNRILVAIASDGFDVYIEPILRQAGLADIPVFSNRLVHSERGWSAVFPGATESCTCFCASCKRNAVLRALAEDDLLIYVGDGRSDTCAARHADVIFAKHHLAAWCTQERVPHHPFRTLHDVHRILAGHLATNSLRPRRQAHLARAAAVAAE